MAQLAEIIYDEQVLPAIIKVIDEAEKYIVLVSPFNNFPQRLLQAFDRAGNKRISIVAVCRKGQEQGEKDNAKNERASREKLHKIGAKVYAVEDLHAKIYYNESFGIVTSMNLYDYSDRKSMEFGLRITDAATLEGIRRYVEDRLITPSRSESSSKPTAPRTPAARPPKAHPKQAQAPGFCLACGRAEIGFNPAKPLCYDCYLLVQEHGELEDFMFDYCHFCGNKRANISFAKPLCRLCYRKVSAA